MTLNLSKSVNCRRFAIRSLFFAQAPSAHFESISAFSHALATGPLPAPRGNLGITSAVRDISDKGAAWRGTTLSLFDDGPWTRTYIASRISPGKRYSRRKIKCTTNPLMIDYFHYNSKPIAIWPCTQKSDSSNFDQLPGRSCDICVAHICLQWIYQLVLFWQLGTGICSCI